VGIRNADDVEPALHIGRTRPLTPSQEVVPVIKPDAGREMSRRAEANTAMGFMMQSARAHQPLAASRSRFFLRDESDYGRLRDR
jgi:hypothetical protein